MNDFSTADIEAVSELRRRLVKLYFEGDESEKEECGGEGGGEGEIINTEAAYARENMDDCTLYRFLLGKQWDVNAAESLFIESMRWRKEVNMALLWHEWEATLQKSHSDEDESGLTERVRLGEALRYVYHCGSATNGNPLLVERIGMCDMKGMQNDREALKAQLCAYAIQLERAWRHLRARNDKSAAVVVVDGAGVNLRWMSKIGWFSSEVSRVASNYPELTERIIICRCPAPRLISVLWKVLESRLPERTRQKVRVCGSDWQMTLDKVVQGGTAALPEFLGGKKIDTGHPVRFCNKKWAPPQAVNDARRRLLIL